MTEEPYYRSYRDGLAKELMELPKPLRREILKQARETEAFQAAFMDYMYEKMKPQLEEKERKYLEEKPDLSFNLEDDNDLRSKLLFLSRWIYKGIGDYDPYGGDCDCKEVTSRFASYLKEKGIETKIIERGYKIWDGEQYNSNFGHVFLLILNGDEKVLVDPTYLQWVVDGERENFNPVLVFRYHTEEELVEELKKIPFRRDILILPLYLGFNSKESGEIFKNKGCIVESDDVLRMD